MADVSAEEGESNQQIEGTDVLKYRCCMIQASGDMMWVLWDMSARLWVDISSLVNERPQGTFLDRLEHPRVYLSPYNVLHTCDCKTLLSRELSDVSSFSNSLFTSVRASSWSFCSSTTSCFIWENSVFTSPILFITFTAFPCKSSQYIEQSLSRACFNGPV